MKAIKSRTVSFAEVETIRCPKCASEPACQCRKMAGKSITRAVKLAPHIERAIAYFELTDQSGPCVAMKAFDPMDDCMLENDHKGEHAWKSQRPTKEEV